MKKLLYIFILVSLLLNNCKCKKDNPQPNPTPVVPLQPVTEYSFFKTGTYWILKDSASGVEDSVYVGFDTAFQYHLGPGNWQREGNYMYYVCRSYNFTDGYRYDYTIDYGYYGSNGTDPDTPNKIVGPQRRKHSLISGDVGTSFMMTNIFNEQYPLTYYTSPGTVYYKEWFDSLDVNGIIYHHVVHFQDTENASEKFIVGSMGSINPTTDYYIAKNIGVIKIRINDNRFNMLHKTQNLIRYHVVQ